MSWDIDSGDIGILLVKVKTWNASHAQATAPILTADELQQWKFFEMKNCSPLVGLEPTLAQAITGSKIDHHCASRCPGA